MDERFLFRPSLLKFLKSRNFKPKKLVDDGNFNQGLVLDIAPEKEVIGKIFASWNVAEFTVWPNLLHESLVPLLDIMIINEAMWISISPYIKTCLGSLIEDMAFVQHPKCFDCKKSYARDILRGLEYLHDRSISLLSLNTHDILICGESDKALISNFSCCVTTKTATKLQLPISRFHILPPELTQFQDGDHTDDVFECIPIDMWLFGVLVLQMFTAYDLPKTEALTAMDFLNGLSLDVLAKANIGSPLCIETPSRLREFLEPFLREDPLQRISAKEAKESYFLKKSDERLDMPARYFWEIKDALETLSNANKATELQSKCEHKSSVHTICDGTNVQYKTQCSTKSLSLEDPNCRKAKSELHCEKNTPQIEGKFQPYNGVTIINYSYEHNNYVFEKTPVEPDLFHYPKPHLKTAPKSFEPFPILSECNSGQEKDPWKESEWHQTTACSETHGNNLHSAMNEFSNSKLYSRKGTSPVNDQLANNQICGRFHQLNMRLDNNGISSEPSTTTDVTIKGRLTDNSFGCNETAFGNKLFRPCLTRQNAFRIKKRSGIKTQFGFKTILPVVEQEHADIQNFIPGQRDKTSFALFMDGMCSYNFKMFSKNKPETEKVSDRGILCQNITTDLVNDMVDVSPDTRIPLCMNLKSDIDIKRNQNDQRKNKKKSKFLKILCPGSKAKFQSD